MGVLAPLLPSGQPAVYGGGASSSGTEAASWLYKFTDIYRTVAPGEIEPIDLTGIGGGCKVWETIGGVEVVSFVLTGGVGEFTLSVDDAATAGLAGAADIRGRQCVWGCWLQDATDRLQIWHPSVSKFTIYQEK